MKIVFSLFHKIEKKRGKTVVQSEGGRAAERIGKRKNLLDKTILLWYIIINNRNCY